MIGKKDLNCRYLEVEKFLNENQFPLEYMCFFSTDTLQALFFNIILLLCDISLRGSVAEWLGHWSCYLLVPALHPTTHWI